MTKQATPDMIERVARAMCESDYAQWDAAHFGDTANGEEPEEQREYWRAKARAAIEAMTEPTEVMYRAALDALVPAGDASACWYAMIDAALSTQNTED